MRALVIAASAIALGLSACAEQPRSQTGGGASSEIKQDTKDAALTGRVKTALAADVGLKTLKIDVDSAGTIVTLNGTVESADTKRRAEEVAMRVQGVSSVRNNLSVK